LREDSRDLYDINPSLSGVSLVGSSGYLFVLIVITLYDLWWPLSVL